MFSIITSIESWHTFQHRNGMCQATIVVLLTTTARRQVVDATSKFVKIAEVLLLPVFSYFVVGDVHTAAPPSTLLTFARDSPAAVINAYISYVLLSNTFPIVSTFDRDTGYRIQDGQINVIFK